MYTFFIASQSLIQNLILLISMNLTLNKYNMCIANKYFKIIQIIFNRIYYFYACILIKSKFYILMITLYS